MPESVEFPVEVDFGDSPHTFLVEWKWYGMESMLIDPDLNPRLEVRVSQVDRLDPGVRSVLESFVGHFGSPCSYDHDGDCQAHMLQPASECAVAIATALLLS